MTPQLIYNHSIEDSDIQASLTLQQQVERTLTD